MTTNQSRVLMSLAIAGLGASPAGVHAQDAPERLLLQVVDASNDDLARFGSGESFVQTLDSRDKRELVQVYAIRVGAPADFLLDRIRAEHLLLDDAESAEDRGFFGSPPNEGDLDGLTLTRSHVRSLESCRPRDCDLKLPLDVIDALHREVDWSGRDAREDARSFFRRSMHRIMTDYVSHGDAAGLTYGDKPEPLRVEDGFDALLDDAEEIASVDASFARHLSAYPEERLPGVEDQFTWTVEDLGTKTLVSLNHIAVRAGRSQGEPAMIGVKRVYSGHYFQAGLRLVFVGPGAVNGADGSYVIVVDRRRFDGELGGLRRTATERRLERHAESVLDSVKSQVEAAYDR